MYKNRIRSLTPNRDPQFFINCSEIAFDERVRYIESVCHMLIESRFGACLVEPVIIDLGDRPEIEPVDFLNLCDGELDGAAPYYFFSSQGRAVCQAAKAANRRAKQTCLSSRAALAANSPTALTPNQGRGSP